MTSLLCLIAAFLLIFLNAFFVAAEFGMVKIRQSRISLIQASYGFRGKILARVHRHLDAYLSACQLGITLASLGLGWIGEPAVADLLHPLFAFMNLSEDYIHFISFLLAFTCLSFLHIVLGELMPKTLAIRQSELIGLWTVVPLYGFYWMMYPAIWFLNTCSNFFLRIFNLDSFHEGGHYYTSDEIKIVLNSSRLHGELAKDEAYILEHTMDFADLRVTEVMRPKENIISIDLSEGVKSNMATILKHKYSRYPVFDIKKKKYIGIIHVKDLLSVDLNMIKSLRTFIRPIVKISHQMPALTLLKEFRLGHSHFALIFNSKQSLIGFATLDDLLKVMIGKIHDEFHRTYDDWYLNADGSMTVHGDVALYIIEQNFDCKINKNDYNTLNGLILHRLNEIPVEGQWLKFKEFNLKIEKINAARIIQARITPKQKRRKTDEHSVS